MRMIKLKDLLVEQIAPEDIWSPVFRRLKKVTDDEREFLESYQYPPNYVSLNPPAQVQWQWTEERDKGNITYGVMWVKEIYHDSPRTVDRENPKRYKVVTVCQNNSNGQRGVVLDYCRASDTFNEKQDISVLKSFLDSLEFIGENYVEDIDSPTFFGPAAGFNT